MPLECAMPLTYWETKWLTGGRAYSAPGSASSRTKPCSFFFEYCADNSAIACVDFGCSRRSESWATSGYTAVTDCIGAVRSDAAPKFEHRFKTKLGEQTLRLVETLGITPVVPPKAN